MSDALVKRLREGATWDDDIEAANLIEELEANVNLKADFIDATLNQLAASEQRISELMKAIEERDEALNQLDSARHSVDVLEKRGAELEAKLRKALAALGDIDNGEPEWPDDPQKELDWCRNRANKTLAELEG